MGTGSWDSSAWNSYSTSSISGKSTSAIYTSSRIQDKYNPKLITMRESRDSADHPNSTPIIIGLDVTGSMDNILKEVANGCGRLVEGILDKKPVTDPQIMFSAIGDVYCDDAPLQVTQFESDIRIAEQIKDLYFERGGGGNDSESYPALWAFARDKIVTDNFDKRGKKGFIFTMGDDGWPRKLDGYHLDDFLGLKNEDIDTEVLLDSVLKKWEVFHLCLRQGGTYSDRDLRRWQQLLGERAIPITDHAKIPEIIISILQAVAGEDLDTIVNGWDGSTSMAVKTAISNLAVGTKKNGIVRF